MKKRERYITIIRTAVVGGSLLSCYCGSLLRNVGIISLAAFVLAPISQAGTTNIVLRLDADQFGSAVSGLSLWADKSVYGHDATQTTANRQPSVVLNVQNGLPVVRFTGGYRLGDEDWMVVQHTYATGSAFIVAKYNGTTFNWYDGLYGSSTNNAAVGQYWSGNNGAATWGNEAGSGFENSKYLNGTLSSTALTNPSKFNLYSGVDTTPNSFTGWSIGRDRSFGDRSWEGDIAEVIVYEEALSDFNRKGVEVFLDEKWALGLNLRNSYGAGNFNDDLQALGLITTTKMALRLDASKFGSAVTGLATWSDSSGNGRNATQTTASLRPDVVMNVQNSQPVVRFDGTDDFMTVAHSYVTGSAFIIAKYNSITFNWWDGLYGSATDNGGTGIYWSGVNTASTWSQETGSQFRGAQYLNGALTTTALTNPSKFNLYSGVDASPNSFTSWSIGRDRGIGGRSWEGDIAEVIVYEEALSPFDRKGVEVYLDEKWALGLNLRASYGASTFNEDTIALGLESPLESPLGTVILIY